MSTLLNISHRSILLVEDNPTDELLTVRALEKSAVPVNIIVTRDGAEAIDYLFAQGKFLERDSQEMPHLILLDLKLPKLDGLDVLKKIRSNKRTGHLPVIILTSSKEERDIIESYRFGANSYVHKPVDYEQFHDVAKELGFYWFNINELPDYDLKLESE
jgi:two-component system response regulator